MNFGLIAAICVLLAPFSAWAQGVEALNLLDETAGAYALIQQMNATRAIIDEIWTVMAIALVFGMQGGFMLLEAGLSRSKNAINVAQKNLADFLVAGFLFFLFGFGLMFGHSFVGLAGFWGSFPIDLEGQQYSFFLFQLVFCATTVTIISGAVSERMSFTAYLMITAIMALWIYPVFGHWVWGNVYYADNISWLTELGFLDFAGSTVVHSVGGWVGLAGIMVLGARSGRFDEHGNPVQINGHSTVLATLGVILLWVGWIGFNGGTTPAHEAAFSRIIANTLLAGLCGGAVGMLVGRFLDGVFRPETSINGILAGLVAITAVCNIVDNHQAMLIGMVAAPIAHFAHHVLTNKFRLDDVVGAISVHAVAGVWGTLSVAIFGDIDALPTGNRLAQLGVQLVGVVACFAWAFGNGWLAFKLIDKLVGVRVSASDERRGLNIAEHGVTLGTGDLRERLSEAARSEQSFDVIANMEASGGDEAAEIVDVLHGIVDERRQAEIERQLSEERFRDFATSAADLFFETDQELRLVYVSDRMHEFFAGGQGNVLGSSFIEVFRPHEPLSSPRLLEELNERMAIRDAFFEIAGENGSTFDDFRILSVSAMPILSAKGCFQGYRGTASDITDAIKRQNEVTHMALHDDMTGLANRAHFSNEIDRVLEESGQDNAFVSILVIDLDGFKDINDTFGHDAGDALLKTVAKRLEENTRPHDVLARLGGDEFAVIHWGAKANAGSVRATAKRIVDAVSKAVQHEGQEFRVSCSIGIACAPEDGLSAAELSKNADLALYEAKRLGKNMIKRVSEPLRAARRERRQLEQQLKEALENGEIFPVFQPKVCLQTGVVQGAEALARWFHPERGWIPPDQFIPIAEETGVILELGNMILEKACAEAKNWSVGPHGPLSIAVNMSPAQLIHQDMASVLRQVLKSTGLPASLVELEITEHLLMKSESRTLGALNRLRDMNVKLSIDDFGTGHSSLAYLKQFPLSQLKIDRSFIKDIHLESDLKITKAIIQLAQALELDIVAEGVEEISQAAILKKLGCNYGQGYLFFKPLPGEKLRKLAAAQAERQAVLEVQ